MATVSAHTLTREVGEPDPAPPRALPGSRPEQRRTSSGRVLVLNASYEPINVCTVRRAAVLILKQRAEILEHADWALHAETLTLPRPVVIRLITYVKIPRDAHRRKITRRAVFARDRWTCQYCGHERGITWSTVSVPWPEPQYWQAQPSRAKIARRVILRLCASRGTRT